MHSAEFAVALNRSNVDELVEGYIALRSERDSAFIVDHEEFKRNVHEMLVTESLHTMKYKADQKELVDGLMKVLRVYSEVLQE